MIEALDDRRSYFCGPNVSHLQALVEDLHVLLVELPPVQTNLGPRKSSSSSRAFRQTRHEEEHLQEPKFLVELDN